MQEDLDQLIRECSSRERSSQSKLYSLLSPKMFGVCLRYSRSREEAEEILQEGFMKVFGNIQQYKFEGSFEGWVRKIMVNCALQKFRTKSHLQVVVNISAINNDFHGDENISSQLGTKELLKLVQQLPAAYRIIFNLYVFEGLKHREIAELLGISEGTSKSNLSDARTILQKSVGKNSLVAKKIK